MALAVIAFGCGGGGRGPDGGGGGDAGSRTGHDGGGARDAGPASDAGPHPDSGPRPDGASGGGSDVIAGCTIFPGDNPWNQDVSALPLHARGAQILANMNPTQGLHPDWGDWSTNRYGIPWSSGTGAPALPMHWTADWGPTESDPMACPDGSGDFCYPIPSAARIEGGPDAGSGDDRHVLYLDTGGAPDDCTLYELYQATLMGPGWSAANGAIFHLGSDNLRPFGWTSADAAGLPILPGLVRVDEVLGGEIRHAIRFTMGTTAQAYVPPATHAAGSSETDLPPMGLRLRLRADYPVDGAAPPVQVVLRAMQTYGLILADNGSDWYISGDSDDRWDPMMDALVSGLRAVHGSDFEILDTGSSMAE